MKACRHCRKRFEPRSSLQVVCSTPCAIAYRATDGARRHVSRAMAQEKREYRVRSETVPRATARAQAAFNAYVRERDAEQPCISCGRLDLRDPLTGGGWDAGHYRTVAACPQLRFEPDNCHRQCKFCNRGRAQSVEHRAGVLARIGAERLAWIEGPHELPKLTVADLVAIRERFQRMTNEIKRRRGKI